MRVKVGTDTDSEIEDKTNGLGCHVLKTPSSLTVRGPSYISIRERLIFPLVKRYVTVCVLQ